MKETISIFMGVLFCKIHCPFMCFCKPCAAAHLYTSGPLKLEDTPHIVSSQACAVSDKETSGTHEAKSVLRSCMRNRDATREVGKKRVQWMDSVGKELVEIKESESRWLLYLFLCAVFDLPVVMNAIGRKNQPWIN